MTASNMRQVSMGSVLGLVVGVGLRAFSRVFVVLFGMGIILVEVSCLDFRREAVFADDCSGLLPKDTTSCLPANCRNM
jgi:hypothetical protein